MLFRLLMRCSWAGALFLCACSDEGGPKAAPDAGSADAETLDGSVHSDADATIAEEDSGLSVPPLCTETAREATRGSPLALSADGSILVALSRGYQGAVAVVDVSTENGNVRAELRSQLQVGAEPAQVAVDACGQRAYVLLRRAKKVLEVLDLRGTPRRGREIEVGSEPTGITISPNNNFLYVANWVDGTVSVVDTHSFGLARTIDLNPILAAEGLLGDSVSATRHRAALAHPRSVALTNDGDPEDGDETLYVTEFFSQRIAPQGTAGSSADENRVGLVYAVDLGDFTVRPIRLSPLSDTGFKAVTGAGAELVTGCYPNQLQSITLRGDFAYVTSICASPEGPNGATPIAGTTCASSADCTFGECIGTRCVATQNVKTLTHPVVHVVNTTTGSEVGTAINLNKEFDDWYAAHGTPDDWNRRYPLASNEIAFEPDTGRALVAANGADAVFRLEFDASSGALESVGGAATGFIDLGLYGGSDTDRVSRGENPIGVTVSSDGRYGFVLNDLSRNVSVVDLARDAVVGSESGPEAALIVDVGVDPQYWEEPLNMGRRFFNTGLGRWSLDGQAWSACQVCHFDGLTDNVTWYGARGPRQATSLDGSFDKNSSVHRIYNWNAIFDEIEDFEIIARSLAGAVGAVVQSNQSPPQYSDRIALDSPGSVFGLNGSAAKEAEGSAVDDWSAIGAWLRSLRPPRAPSNLVVSEVAAGEEIFWKIARCQSCHSGPPLWTVSTVFYDLAQDPAITESFFATPYDATGFPATLLPAPEGDRFIRSPDPFDPQNDSIQCALREVGTYGVSPLAVGVVEIRGDMTTPGQGNPLDSKGNETVGHGFNVPSLFGVAAGAPYFHAGNARTLEELLSDLFALHRDGFGTDASYFADERHVNQLVQYLLSIDTDTSPPADLTDDLRTVGGNLCALP